MAGEDVIIGSVIAIVMAFIAIAIFIGIAVWIYLSIAYMAIAKKNKQNIEQMNMNYINFYSK